MPEPGKAVVPVSLAGLWAFLACLVLSVVSVRRGVPFVYPAKAATEYVQDSSPTIERIAVLPFDEVRVASPYAVGSDRGQATDVPVALRREASEHGEEIVCELGPESNHLGRVDGAALARVLAQELASTGQYRRVRCVEGLDGLKDDDTVVIRGRVAEAGLRILKDGSRAYSVGVEFSAGRWFCVSRQVQPAFWEKTLRRKARAEGAPAVYEISALVRALCADAAKALGEASWNDPVQAAP